MTPTWVLGTPFRQHDPAHCLLSIAAVMLPGVLKGTGGILPPSGPVVAGPVTSDNDQQPGTDTAQSPQVIIK